MSRVTLPPSVELALAAGLPALVDLIARELPAAFAPIADAYRPQVLSAAERWARALLGDVLTPPVHVQAGPDVEVAITIHGAPEPRDDDPTI